MNRIENELLRDIKRIIRRNPKRSAAQPILDYVLQKFTPKIHPSMDRRVANAQDPELVLKTVCEYLKVSIEELKVRTRKKEIVYGRQLCMYLLLLKTNLSLKSIGDLFGHDHTSVMHSREKIKGFIDVYPEVSEEITMLYNQLSRKEKKIA